MNLGSKKNLNQKPKKQPRQMPSHVGLVDKLRKRNAVLEKQLKKLRGK